MRAILINSKKREITEAETGVDVLKFMQKAVGGWIEWACRLENGDILFVNEEALLGNPRFFFEYAGEPRAFAGDGIILGSAVVDGEGKTVDASVSLDTVVAAVRFLHVAGARARR